MGKRIAVIVIVGFIFWSLFSYSARPNTLTVLDVGQGLSMLYTDQSGWQLLYDGGPGAAVVAELGQALPVWDRSIDVVVLSHPHSDHAAGLVHVLTRYRVGELWLSAPASNDDDTRALLQIAHSKSIPVRVISRGWQLLLPSGAILTTLTPSLSFPDRPPPRAHAATPVMTIKTTTATLMFTGDLDPEDETGLLQFCAVSLLCPTHVDLLQVAHHGSRTVTSEKFLQRFTPIEAVIGVGKDNSYHHPHLETLQRLAAHHVTVFRTDTDGRITLKLDQIAHNR